MKDCPSYFPFNKVNRQGHPLQHYPDSEIKSIGANAMNKENSVTTPFRGFRSYFIFISALLVLGTSSIAFGAETIMTAPQDTVSIKLKWNDPPAKVLLKEWKCTGTYSDGTPGGTLMDQVRSKINWIAGLNTLYPNDSSGMNNRAQEDIQKALDSSVWVITFRPVSKGPYDAPHGQTKTYKIKTCYTEKEYEQYVAFLKKLLEQLKNSKDPVGDAKKMMAQL